MPYNPDKGWKAHAERDRYTLFNGYGLESIAKNISALRDRSIDIPNKVKGIRIINGHLANPDVKIRAVQELGLVTSLQTLMDDMLSAELDGWACKLVQSLAVLPNCVVSLYWQRVKFASTLHVSMSIKNMVTRCICVLVPSESRPASPGTPKQRFFAREWAARALEQMTMAWDGQALLMGEQTSLNQRAWVGENKGVHEYEPMDTDAVRRALWSALVEVLGEVSLIQEDGSDAPHIHVLVTSALRTATQLTRSTIGTQMAIESGAIEALSRLLGMYGALGHSRWIGKQHHTEVVETACSCLWNTLLDNEGKHRAVSLCLVPDILGRLLWVLLPHSTRYLQCLSTLAGCTAAFFLDVEGKKLGVLPVPDCADNEDMASLLLRLLQAPPCTFPHLTPDANHEYQRWQNAVPVVTMKEYGTKVTAAENTISNSVQALRVLSELPAARGRMLALLEKQPGSSVLTAQIYEGTAFGSTAVHQSDVLRPNYTTALQTSSEFQNQTMPS
eukprot:gene4595-835_t